MTPEVSSISVIYKGEAYIVRDFITCPKADSCARNFACRRELCLIADPDEWVCIIDTVPVNFKGKYNSLISNGKSHEEALGILSMWSGASRENIASIL